MGKDNLLDIELFKEISRIMTLENNKESYSNFQDVMNDLYPKNCKVKIGWVSGEEISFTLVYEKMEIKNHLTYSLKI